jgi:hypothetical protein
MSNKQIFYLLIGAAVYATLISIMDWQCNPHPQPPPTDSTSLWKSQAKQAGNAAAIYMTEVSRLQSRLLEKDNQLKDVLAHEKELTYTNLGLIKRLRETAPTDCEPYIDSTVTYYTEIMDVKDSSYAKLFEKLLVTDSISLVKDSVIVELGVQVDMQGKVIEQIEADLKKAERAKRRAKIGAKIILFAAAAYTGVVMYLTVIK